MKRIYFITLVACLNVFFSSLTYSHNFCQNSHLDQCRLHSSDVGLCGRLVFGRLPDALPHEMRICHRQYLVSSNLISKTPNWVASHLVSGHRIIIKRGNFFCPDPCLKVGERSELADYYGVFPKYNRGHMTPASSNKQDQEAYYESYYLSNMVPQNPTNNGGIWQILEVYTNTWVEKYGELYVITGPIQDYDTKKHEVIGPGKVWAPAALFKIIYSPAKQKVLSFVIPNVPLGEDKLKDYLTSIDKINALTGLNLFQDLPSALKSSVSASIWPV